MSEFTWGDMPKSQIDSQLITEAISEMIAEHEADPTAHLGTGESLEQHKSNEIIDHPASSVFDDKFAYDRNSIKLDFSNFELYNYSSGVEYVSINTLYFYSPNSSSARWFYAIPSDMYDGADFAFSKNPRFLIRFMVTDTTSQEGYLMIGDRDEGNGFGLKISNNSLYAVYYNSSHALQSTLLQTISANVIYKTECRIVDGEVFEIWVNNLLVNSIALEDIPSVPTTILGTPWIDWKSTTSSAKELFVRDFYWEADI